MSINTAREGHTYPAITYQVGREAVREFARAVKADDPAHHDTEAAARLGHQDLLAPPTFGVVVSITAGETLRAATTLERIRTMGAGAMVTTVTEITHDGAPRTTVTSTLLVRTDEGDA